MPDQHGNRVRWVYGRSGDQYHNEAWRWVSTLKVVSDVSVEFGREQWEDPAVTLQIVKDCMEIARISAAADDPEQTDAKDLVQRLPEIKPTPTVSRSPRPSHELVRRRTFRKTLDAGAPA